jgi:hypothetical protein
MRFEPIEHFVATKSTREFARERIFQASPHIEGPAVCMKWHDFGRHSGGF